MKKILTAGLAVIMLVCTLTGCGSNKFTRGTWTDEQNFVNESAEISVSVPEDWTHATDDELAEIMGIAADSMKEDGNSNVITDAMLKLSTIYDAMIYAPSQSNLIIMYQNLDIVGDITEDGYIETTKEQLEETEFGYTYSDVFEQKLGSATYKGLTGTIEGAFSQTILVRKVDNYMVVVMSTVLEGEDINDFYACFN